MKNQTYISCLFGISMLIVNLCLVGCGFTNSDKADRHFEKAKEFAEQEELEKARIELINVLAIRPNKIQAVELLSDVYFRQGNYRDALRMLLNAVTLNPTNTVNRIRLGQIYLAGRKFEEAREEALALNEMNPNNEEGALLYADAVSTPEDIEKAKKLLNPFLKSSNSSASVLLAYGNLLLRAGDIDSAKLSFNRVLEVDEDSALAFRSLGKIAFLEKNMDEAEDYFKKAHDVSSSDSPYRLAYADLLLKTGKREEGKKILETIINEVPESELAAVSLAEISFRDRDYIEAEKHAKVALQRNPNEWRAKGILARLKLVKGDVDSGVKELQELVKEYPNEPILHFGIAQGFFLLGAFSDSEMRLNMALELLPNFFEAAILRAQIYVQTGRYLEAMPVLTEAVSMNPSTPELHYAMARALVGIGNPDSAIQVYDEIFTVYTNQFMAPYLKGIVQKSQDLEKAVDSFEASLGMNPGFIPALYQLIELDMSNGNLDRAESRLQAKLKEDPDAAGVHYYLARCRIKQGKLQEAEAILLDNISKRPEHMESYVLLSQIYNSQNRGDEAEKQLRQLQQKNPDHPGINFILAMSLQNQRNYDQATAIYKEIIQKTPNFTPALNNLAYIQSEISNQPEAAYENAKKARELAPEDGYVADTLGWILTKQGHYDEALPFLVEANRLLPQNAEIASHLAMLHYYQGEKTKADKMLRNLLDNAENLPDRDTLTRQLAILEINPEKIAIEEQEMLQAWIQENNEDPYALSLLARIHLQKGQIDQAETIIKNAFNQHPNHLPLLLAKTSILLSRGSVVEANELAEKAFKMNPMDPEVVKLGGITSLQVKNHSRAYDMLRQAAELRPEDPRVFYAIGEASYALGMTDVSLDSMRKVVDLNPDEKLSNSAKWWIAFVNAALSEDRVERHKDNVNKVLSSKPEFAPARYLSGMIHESKGNYKAALMDYQKLHETSPSVNNLQKRIGIILAEHLNQPEEAYDYVYKALLRVPDDKELTRAQGKIFYARENHQVAAEVLSKVAGQPEADALTYLYLGICQSNLQQTEKARENIQKAIKSGLARTELDLANRTLEKLP